MKTVQDYLDLGVEFFKGDVVIGYKNIEYSKNWHESLQDDDSDEGDVWLDCNIKSFAWRNNDGVKPEYKGLIEVELKDGTVMHPKKSSEFMWELKLSGFSEERSIVKWRPVVLQSDGAHENNDASFKLPIGVDSPELREAFKSLKEHLESKPPFWNKSMQVFSCPCVAVNVEAIKPTLSPKEDKPMNPVYTAEMHAKNERPQVGSEIMIRHKCWSTSKPFDRVTVKAVSDEYIIVSTGSDAIGYSEQHYIIKSMELKPIIKTIKVNGFDVPAPMSEAPEVGSVCFVASINNPAFFYSIYWETISCNKTALSRGLIHSTKSAAIAHAKAMLGIDPNA